MSYITDVYTDGACFENGRSGASAGIGVWFGDNHPWNVSKVVTGNKHTNQVGELQAIREALQIGEARYIRHLRINTDSEYAVKTFTKWYYNWERYGFVNFNGQPVANVGLLSEIMDLYRNAMASGRIVEFNHVPAHFGIRGNEEADRLAREAAQRYQGNRGGRYGGYNNYGGGYSYNGNYY